MVAVSILGVPNDDNSSFMKGPAEAPALIRGELRSDAYSSWSETGIDLGAAGRIVDHGDIQFDNASDPWDLIERDVGRALESGDPLICLGGDHAITHPIMRAVRRRHAAKSRPSFTSTRTPTSITRTRAIRAPIPRPLPGSWRSGCATG